MSGGVSISRLAERRGFDSLTGASYSVAEASMRRTKKTRPAGPQFKPGDKVIDRVTGEEGTVIRSYQITLISEKEGGYTVLVPGLPGCISYGRTVEEAVQNAKEAIELHLENLAAHDQPLPGGQEEHPVFTTLVYVTSSHA